MKRISQTVNQSVSPLGVTDGSLVVRRISYSSSTEINKFC